MVVDVHDLNQLAELARRIAPRIPRGSTVMTLEGELGAGKTAFVRELVTAMGIDPERVSSPTFSLVNMYAGERVVYHIDLYRVENRRELDGLDLEEVLSVPDALVLVEWPAVAAHLVGPHALAIRIERAAGETRHFHVPDRLWEDAC